MKSDVQKMSHKIGLKGDPTLPHAHPKWCNGLYNKYRENSEMIKDN